MMGHGSNGGGGDGSGGDGSGGNGRDGNGGGDDSSTGCVIVGSGHRIAVVTGVVLAETAKAGDGADSSGLDGEWRRFK